MAVRPPLSPAAMAPAASADGVAADASAGICRRRRRVHEYASSRILCGQHPQPAHAPGLRSSCRGISDDRARSSRNGGRNHPGTPSEIKSECWATSSRIRGRLPPESAHIPPDRVWVARFRCRVGLLRCPGIAVSLPRPAGRHRRVPAGQSRNSDQAGRAPRFFGLIKRAPAF
jgi:hypothetical protein